MELTLHPGDAKAFWAARLPAGTVGCAWLGQAGFAIRHGIHRLLVDPYLSNHLARKYAGKEFPHLRMMPAPLPAEEFRPLDAVFCTHRHGDHMDPDSLPLLARLNPGCRVVVPRAERETALGMGLPEEQLLSINAGERLTLEGGISVTALASAHEEPRVNGEGQHHFLGYVFQLGEVVLYHSGDCVVYEGLARQLRELGVAAALLPVNGRSPRLREKGFRGNMTFDEAAQLCLEAGIPWLVPHHFGMFEFNTVGTAELERRRQELTGSRLRCAVPASGYYQVLEPEG